jgi:membrane protein
VEERLKTSRSKSQSLDWRIAVKPFLVRVWSSIRGAALEFAKDWKAVGSYLIEPETHVFAFSIAANVLLAFYPFVLVMLSISKHVFHSTPAINALYVAIQDYFPGGTGFTIVRNLDLSLHQVRRMEWVSVLLLLLIANGVFLPLEVELNRAWGVVKGRNLLMNQLVSTGLIFTCGILALLSAAVTASGRVLWQQVFGTASQVPWLLSDGIFKLTSLPFTVLILFLVYWRLPNTKVPGWRVLPRAVVIAAILELLKWLNLAIWPWVRSKFWREYGGFVDSITILTWSFFAGLIVLAGADWSARRARAAQALDQANDAGDPALRVVPTVAFQGTTGRIG